MKSRRTCLEAYTRDIDKTTLQKPQKGLALCFDVGIKATGGSRQGHPRYTGAREGRPWVAHNTIHSATNLHNQKTDATVFDNVHGSGAMLNPVSSARIQQRTQRRRVEQEVDGHFVGVTCSRDRKHARPEDQIQERGVHRQSPE